MVLVVVMHEQQKIKREESKKGYKMFFPLVDQLARVINIDIHIGSTHEVLQVSERKIKAACVGYASAKLSSKSQ